TFNVGVAQYTPMLHAKAQLVDSSGNIVATAADASSLSQTITATLGAGTYYLLVKSFGQYGDLGQYSVTGSISPRLGFTLAQSADHSYINWTTGTSSGQIAIADTN